MNDRTAITPAPVNGRERRNRSSISGSAVLRSTRMNAAAASAATANSASTGTAVQPATGPWMTA